MGFSGSRPSINTPPRFIKPQHRPYAESLKTLLLEGITLYIECSDKFHAGELLSIHSIAEVRNLWRSVTRARRRKDNGVPLLWFTITPLSFISRKRALPSRSSRKCVNSDLRHQKTPYKKQGAVSTSVRNIHPSTAATIHTIAGFNRQLHSTRSTTPLRDSSGSSLGTRCFKSHPSFSSLNQIFGRTEREVQNRNSRRSRSCHS